MSKKESFQMQTLRHYFSIDGNIATLKLIYDTFSELINPNFGDDNIEKLNEKLFSDIKEAVSLLPRKFKLNIKIVIKDFGNYTKEECQRIIKQNVQLVGYRKLKESNIKRVSGWTLIGIGAAILLVSYFLRKYDLWFDLINISGTLFVWEGVDMGFIERNMESKAMRTLAKSINDISVEGV